jgi:DNA primase small subunit
MPLTPENLPGILREHYRSCDLDIPNLPRREIAWEPWDRHHGFESMTDLRAAMIDATPTSAYYSTAKWLNPKGNAGTGNPNESWKRKSWTGTDLTFDLDYDHMAGVEDLSYKQQIEAIASQTSRLIDILENQYNITEYQIAFSGRRGFHVKVTDEDYSLLDKMDRRAICNQIMGEFIDRRTVLKTLQLNTKVGELSCTLGEASLYSWSGLTRLAVSTLTTQFLESSSQHLIQYIKDNWPKKLTTKELNILAGRFSNPVFLRRLEKTGDLRAFLGDYATKTRLENVYTMFLNEAIKIYGVSIDISVTPDTRRLIRMPGSINTKHGYECRTISKEEVEDIDLLFFLSEQTFGSEEVEIEIPKPMTVHGYQTIHLEKGIHTLRKCDAVLALCQM